MVFFPIFSIIAYTIPILYHMEEEKDKEIAKKKKKKKRKPERELRVILDVLLFVSG